MITIITLFFNFYSTTNEGIVSWSLWGSELLNMTKPFLLNEFSISRVIPRNLLSYLPINSILQKTFIGSVLHFQILIFGAKIQIIFIWNVAKWNFFVDFWLENSNKKIEWFSNNVVGCTHIYWCTSSFFKNFLHFLSLLGGL